MICENIEFLGTLFGIYNSNENIFIQNLKPYIMRKLLFFFTALVLGTTGILASTSDDKVAERNAYRYNKSFIFVEQGITFSVYPDGEFDFYVDSRLGNSRRNVTFNSGFDYSPYAQYDDYGAVVQVENIPIFYDYYGRVSQVGDININYRNRRVHSVGNMFVFYNNNGLYDYHTGYINSFNRFYVYRPFHRFFARPAIGFSLVFNRPYRRYYSPIRYTFYNPYRYNKRRAYAKIGREHRYNKVRRERSTIYRNDKRVAVRDNARRSNRSVARNTNVGRTNKNAQRGNNANRTVTRTNRSVTRTDGRNTTVRSSSYRKGNATTNRTVVKRTPRSTTVKRSTTVRKPQTSSSNRTVRSTTNRTQRSVAKPTQRSSRSVASRSSSSRSVRQAPARSSRSTASRSTTSRSVRTAPARSARSKSSANTSRSRGRQ